MLQQLKQRQLIDALNAQSKSVGIAQTIAALSKTIEQASDKQGAMFIYTHVPLNTQEQHAPNVSKTTEDIFYVEEL